MRVKERECSIVGDKVSCNKPEDKIFTSNDLRFRSVIRNGKNGNNGIDGDGNGGQSNRNETLFTVSRGLGAYANAKKAVDDLGGMCSFVKKGDLVAVKANMTGGVPELLHTFTNKEVLSSVIDQVRECEGEPFVFDSDMIWTKMQPVAEKSGFYEWGREKKVPIVNLATENKVKFDFGKDSKIEVDEGSQLLKEADVIINVPVAKNHIMTGITASLKNMYGSLPTENKAKYHAKGINSSIATVNKTFRPNLTVVDVISGCEGGGPLTCRAIEPPPDTVIASNDPVCADSVVAKIMGYEKPTDIQHIDLAEKMGVGTSKCFYESDGKLNPPHEKDGKWTIVQDKGAMASLITDIVTNSMKWNAMIPVMDVIADAGLGGLHYTFKYKMADLWDFVIYATERWSARAKIDEEPKIDA